MKKIAVLGMLAVAAIVVLGQMASVQACEGSCKKPKTTSPAPAPQPEEPQA